MTGGRASRQKGDRFERALVRTLQHAGFIAERVRLSGAAHGHFGGDLSVPLLGVDRRIEVKCRGARFRQLYRWLNGADLLIVRADRSKPLVVIPFHLAIQVAKAAENSRTRATGEPDAALPANRDSRRPDVMDTNEKTANALTVSDGFSDSGDATASPLRGISFRFKDGDYLAYSEPFNVKGRTFAAFDKADGWQKLAEGIPPEYLIRQPGKLRPPRPQVDEKDWPLDLNNKPAHPWKLTRYLYLVDTNTGELSTFWTNTIGGEKAFRELEDQVRFARQVHPQAIAIIALESRDMPTQYGGTTPKPYFRICGYKMRGEDDLQKLLTGETMAPALVEVKKPSLAEEMNDGLPNFDEAPKKQKRKKQ